MDQQNNQLFTRPRTISQNENIDFLPNNFGDNITQLSQAPQLNNLNNLNNSNNSNQLTQIHNIIQTNYSSITKPNLVLDLNGLLIFSTRLIDLSNIGKYTSYKNLLILYKDYDQNIFIMYYRNYLKEFLLEINNYYNIYILSTMNKTLTDLCITSIINLLGVNIFTNIIIKTIDQVKNLELLKLDPKKTIIVDTKKNWENQDKNLILINLFKGPLDQTNDNNTDLIYLKKCLSRIYKLYIDNSYGDITNYIHECI